MATDLYVWSYVVAYVTFAVGLVSSAARFYSRALVVKSWGWDDTASCAVVVVNIIHQVVLQLFLNLRCGRPGNLDCSFQSLDLLRTAFIEEIVIYAAHCIIKATFLLFFLRLSPLRTFRIFVYVGFGLVFAVLISSLLLTVLQCVPFEKILNPMLHPEVTCVDTRIVMITPPALNIAMDFYILFLPIQTVWSLQMTLRRKITIISTLSLGLVSVTVAILRLPVLVSVTTMKTDASIDVGKMIIVAAFEVQCAIIAVNLPALKPLWSKVRGKDSSTGSKSISLQQSSGGYGGLSSGSRGYGKGTKKGSEGFITRLERELEDNESEERLCATNQGLGALEMEGRPRDMRTEGHLCPKSIVVTTDVDIQSSSASTHTRAAQT